jgi:hypothetical protein
MRTLTLNRTSISTNTFTTTRKQITFRSGSVCRMAVRLDSCSDCRYQVIWELCFHMPKRPCHSKWWTTGPISQFIVKINVLWTSLCFGLSFLFRILSFLKLIRMEPVEALKHGQRTHSLQARPVTCSERIWYSKLALHRLGTIWMWISVRSGAM